MSAECQNRTQAAAWVHAICITRALATSSRGPAIRMPIDFATPAVRGTVGGRRVLERRAKFSLPLDSDAPGPCAGGSGADAGRARMAEQLSTCARRIRSRRAEPDAGSAEL